MVWGEDDVKMISIFSLYDEMTQMSGGYYVEKMITLCYPARVYSNFDDKIVVRC